MIIKHIYILFLQRATEEHLVSLVLEMKFMLNSNFTCTVFIGHYIERQIAAFINMYM